jgi:hypothetical protein
MLNRTAVVAHITTPLNMIWRNIPLIFYPFIHIRLNNILISNKRYDLLEKISKDENFRNELYVKYNL